MKSTVESRLLVERLPLVTYLLELEPPSRALFVSPQMERLFGYTSADFAGDDSFWTDRVAPADRQRFLSARDALRHVREEMYVEYRVRARDGREVWVRDTAVVDEGEDGALYVHGFLTDITHEKSLERDLAAERAQAAAFFRDSSVGMGITDAEGRYVRVNEALAAINGVTPEDHIGRTLKEIAPDVAEEVVPMLQRVRETGTPLHQQEVTIDAGTFVVSYFPIETDGATQYGRVVVDITEQRRAEERYRRLIEQLPLVTYVNALEPTPHITYVSPQIECLYGYPVEDWLRDTTLWDRVIHPDDLEYVLAAEEAARERGESFELEYRIVRSDGTVRWVLDLMDTIRDEHGRPLFEQGFLVDVTTQRESERFFRAVFESSLDAMLITDDHGRFVDANAATCELLGRSRDEVLKLHVGDISPPRTDSEEERQRFFERGEASGSITFARPNGEFREVEYSSRANVVPGRHLTIGRDITERRQLERELWRAQRLESVGRLAGGIAQDFNNLLTAIRGYAQLLIAHAPPASIEHHHAREIDDAAQRAALLTAQLLAFGRRQDLQPRPVELNRLVERLEPTLRHVAEMEVDFALGAGLRAVRVDPSQIEQLLINLVVNAAQVSPDESCIRVRTSNADSPLPDDLPEGRYVVVSVEDQGPGIDPVTLEHLFEPFFTTKDIGDGLGLGLATAYGIAKQSGGTIAVATGDTGSTFAVYLPEATASGDGPRGSGETILAIDADPAVREVLFEVLTNAGYVAVTAETPSDAARLVVDGEVDLLVTELDARHAELLASSLGVEGTLSIRKPYAPRRLLAGVRAALDGLPRTDEAPARFG